MHLNADLNNSMDLHQKLILTPHMQQSLQVLHMNSQDLSEHIKEQALDNPVIEIEPAYEEMTLQEKFLKKLEWISSSGSSVKTYGAPSEENEENEYPLSSSDEDSLHKVLLAQLNTLRLNPVLMRAARYIIQSLDHRGYLDASLKEIAHSSGMLPELVRKALKVVQSLEPWGVGARSLKECLVIQLRHKEVTDPNIYDVIKNHLDELSKNKLTILAAKLGISLEGVKNIQAVIKSLDPNPGSRYDNMESVQYAYPDITVVKFEDHFEVLINDFLYPSIRINNTYKDLIRSSDEATRGFISNKMDQAMFLVKCILQRNKTLLGVAKTLVELQTEFMSKGPGHLAPMLLNGIATRLNIHESTVSRAINGKYLQCVWGIFEMKYFFSSAISSNRDTTTHENIKLLLKKIIEGEDRKKPLSDQKIADELNHKKITISRRTVTKYREELKISNASERKEY